MNPLHTLARAALPLVLSAATACGAAPPTPEALERGLIGPWSGALEYRDYQNNQRYQLPMQVQLRLGPDGATLTREARFDDGPAGAVWITTMSLFDRTGALISGATFRKGRAVELSTERGEVTEFRDDTHWTLVYLRRGEDGDQPADIRITQTRRGSELTALKEAKPPGQPDSAYVFRNQTVLVRQP
jgi:hypothetical protein